MTTEINKPTGLGYCGSPYRRCICGHMENDHYGHKCYASYFEEQEMKCNCTGFTTRAREEMERQVQHEWEYVDEALYRELKEEVKRRGTD